MYNNVKHQHFQHFTKYYDDPKHDALFSANQIDGKP